MDNDASLDGPSGRNQTARRPATGHTRVVALAGMALAVPLMAVLGAVCAVIPGLPWWLGLPLGAAAATAFIAYRLGNAYSALLGALHAEPADADEYVRFHNLVQGLSLAGGVSEPELYVVADPARNAAAVARGAQSAIVATSGLLAALDRISLEAIVAETLVRIGSGDAEAATVGAALFGPLLHGPLRAAAVFGLRRLLADDRDLLADRAAVALTRYPPGLSLAFSTIQSGAVRVASVADELEHMWLVPPAAVDPSAAVPVTAPPLSLRIDVLGEL